METPSLYNRRNTTLFLPKIKGIYFIECIKNGATYIGSSVDIMARWREHIEGCVNPNMAHLTNKRLAIDWKRYGSQYFTFRYELHNLLTFEELQDLEKEYIQTRSPFYNIKDKF